jgi:predicted nucleotidyltransferase
MEFGRAVELIRETESEVAAIYLFGSRARGDDNGASDVDLAFLSRAPLGALARFELQERIAGELHVSVDLVDLRAASTVMRVQVLEHGVVLYERDPAERAEFEAVALGAYARLNEERRGILEDIRRSGRVHG